MAVLFEHYHFTDATLLEEALTHPSYIADNPEANHYERLEFLGDAVLELTVSEFLFAAFPQEKEGDLAKRRAALVCGRSLAKLARQVGLQQHLRLSYGEEKSGGRENPAILENAFEALVGAVYLDGGLQGAQAFLLPLIRPLAQTMTSVPKDPKTTLQEWAQYHKLPLPDYRMVGQSGPSHAPNFTIEISITGEESLQASGTSKKQATRNAARAMLDQLGIDYD